MNPIRTLDELDDELSRPTRGALDTLRQIDGDVMVLGAGGKMGPTVARMLRRGLDEIGHSQRRVLAVSRFSSGTGAAELQRFGVETIAGDLLDRRFVAGLPDVPNIVFMAGQKFGTSGSPELTWAMNTLAPAHVAERFGAARVVVFSTGCVYPLMPVDGPGANEHDPLTPPGEYANSCVGRERLFEHFARQNGMRVLFFRLCYSVELRYGVLLDIAQAVREGRPVDVSMGAVHVIWQRDAGARAIQSLALATSPPAALNVTGMERVRVRDLAVRFGRRFRKDPIIAGEERPTAWVWDASRSDDLFGPPSVSLDDMIEATAAWVEQGGATSGKPTHFEVRDGQF